MGIPPKTTDCLVLVSAGTLTPVARLVQCCLLYGCRDDVLLLVPRVGSRGGVKAALSTALRGAFSAAEEKPTGEEHKQQKQRPYQASKPLHLDRSSANVCIFTYVTYPRNTQAQYTHGCMCGHINMHAGNHKHTHSFSGITVVEREP